MHLLFFSDGHGSTCTANASHRVEARSFGQAHRDGLLRGILFLLALVIPLALKVALSPAQETDQPPAYTHIRITHL